MTILAQGEISPWFFVDLFLILSIPASSIVALVALVCTFGRRFERKFVRIVALLSFLASCLNLLVTWFLSTLPGNIRVSSGVILYGVLLAGAFLISLIACGRAFNFRLPNLPDPE